MQEEAAAHRLGDGQFDLLLGCAGLGPIALDHLVAVLDLDERSPCFIARPPQRRELLARLRLPVRRGQQLRNLNGQLRRLGLQDLERELAGDSLAKPILRLQDRPIGARG